MLAAEAPDIESGCLEGGPWFHRVDAVLRVPGFGTKTVDRILSARRHRTLQWDDLVRIGASMTKAKPFISLPGWSPGGLIDAQNLRARFAPPPKQLSLF